MKGDFNQTPSVLEVLRAGGGSRWVFGWRFIRLPGVWFVFSYFSAGF